MGHAKALINIDSPDVQLRIFNRIVNEGLSVRSVEAIVREIKYPVNKDKVKTGKVQLPKQYLNLRNSLNKLLDTKVDLKKNENGKGSITISFNSEDEFSRISDILLK
jgi:ParB family chromosome partitioning protein